LKSLNNQIDCREYSKIVSIAIASQNGLTFELINDLNFEIEKWHVDDCLLKNEDGSKCDFLLIVKQRSICFWIELKDEDFDDACKQIYFSIRNINEVAHYDNHYARVILGRFAEDRNRIDNIRYVHQKKLVNLIGKDKLKHKTKIITEKISEFIANKQ